MCCLLFMNFRALFHELNPSKFIVYASLFVFSVLLALRLDEYIVWNYYIVFTPLWLWKLVVFLGATTGMVVWLRHPEYRNESSVDLQAMLITACMHLFILLFELLVCTNFEYRVLSYRLAFIPVFCISTLAVVGCVWGFRHDRKLELETFFSINIVQFICISLKWDRVINWSWVVVFIPLWILLALLSVCVLYYIIWALLFMRSPDISTEQRRSHVVNALVSFFIVIPLLAFMVLISRKLDGYSTLNYSVTFVPLQVSLFSLLVMSFYQKGGNHWWFGLRKDFCEVLLDKLPLLREYGNVSYKFSDAVTDSRDSSSDECLERHELCETPKKRESKLVGSILVIDVPD